MNEFQKYSDSEKITHMLDGELSKSESLEMQKLVESNPELKAQMDEELKIREAIGRDRESFKPPFAATAAIFGAIGIDLAILTGAGSQTIGFWAKMISQKAFWPAVSATVATLVTTVSIWFGVFSDEKIPEETQKEISQEKIIETNLTADKIKTEDDNKDNITSVHGKNKTALKVNTQLIDKDSSPRLKSNNSVVVPDVSSAPEPLAILDNVVDILDIPDVLINFSKINTTNDSFNFLSGYDDSFIFSKKKSPRISSGLNENPKGLSLKWDGNAIPDIGYNLGINIYGNSYFSNYGRINVGLNNIFDKTNSSMGVASLYLNTGIQLKYFRTSFMAFIFEGTIGYSKSERAYFIGGGGGTRFFLTEFLPFGLDMNIEAKYEFRQTTGTGIKKANGLTFGFNLIF
jgi:hypothetical protein